jgi:hypothetical protein
MMAKLNAKTKLPVRSEYEEQKAVFAWADIMSSKWPELKYLNGSLNGVRLTIGQAKKAKYGGLKRGVPDIFLPATRKNWAGLFIELKRKEGGRTSPEQKDWLIFLSNQGYYAAVANGSEAAIRIITGYLEMDK